MSPLRRILRVVLLLYALYTFAVGVQATIAAENARNDGRAIDELRARGIAFSQTNYSNTTANRSESTGPVIAAIAIYEFLAAWRGDHASYVLIAGVRVCLYVVLNRVWEWSLGWPAVDHNLAVIVIAAEAALL